jgi:hypothetical protein
MIHYFTNKEGNMDRYSQILQELIKNTGLEGASLVSADGLPISSVLKPGMNSGYERCHFVPGRKGS